MFKNLWQRIKDWIAQPDPQDVNDYMPDGPEPVIDHNSTMPVPEDMQCPTTMPLKVPKDGTK